jgi:putative peptidoglycan lipid II flippase
VNNLVSIAGFLAFIWLFGPAGSSSDWTPAMIALLAGTATLGIIVQTAILFVFWRKTGLHIRPDFGWRGVGLGQIGRLAGWTFLMVVAGQLAGLVQSQVMSRVPEGDPGVFVAQNAWLLFMLPYSIIVLSIGTPYFTQLSEHAAAGRDDEVRGDVGRSIRTLGLFVVAATAALAAAAVPASRIFTDSPDEAVAAAGVLLCYLVSLIPLAVLFVVQRTFYAYDDTRTPFFFTILQCALVVLTAWGALWAFSAGVLPPERLTAAVALGQSFSSVVQVIVATWLLHRRLGALRVGSWMLSLGRFALAAVPAGAAGWLTIQLLGGVAAAIIGLVSLAVYAGFLALLRAPELSVATGLVRRFLPGRR